MSSTTQATQLPPVIPQAIPQAIPQEIVEDNSELILFAQSALTLIGFVTLIILL